MSKFLTEVTQAGRTEFWEHMRDKKHEELQETIEGKRLWRPIDLLKRRKRERQLSHHILNATNTINSSRIRDKELESQHPTA